MAFHIAVRKHARQPQRLLCLCWRTSYRKNTCCLEHRHRSFSVLEKTPDRFQNRFFQKELVSLPVLQRIDVLKRFLDISNVSKDYMVLLYPFCKYLSPEGLNFLILCRSGKSFEPMGLMSIHRKSSMRMRRTEQSMRK